MRIAVLSDIHGEFGKLKMIPVSYTHLTADVVILAIDVAITGMERFKGKKVVKVDTSTLIKNPIAFIQKVEKAIEKEDISHEKNV